MQDADGSTPQDKLAFENDRATFKRWLAERQKHFDEVGFLPSEIAKIALEHGFSPLIVREWETHARFMNLVDRHE